MDVLANIEKRTFVIIGLLVFLIIGGILLFRSRVSSDEATASPTTQLAAVPVYSPAPFYSATSSPAASSASTTTKELPRTGPPTYLLLLAALLPLGLKLRKFGVQPDLEDSTSIWNDRFSKKL